MYLNKYKSININFNFYIPLKIRNKIIKDIKNIITIMFLYKWYININFIYNRNMKILNKKWKNKNIETDILSFPCNDFPSKTYILGDIIISLEKTIYQSIIFGTNIIKEMSILIIHGILHLMLINHEKNLNEKTVQKRLEMNILYKMKNSCSTTLCNRENYILKIIYYIG